MGSKGIGTPSRIFADNDAAFLAGAAAALTTKTGIVGYVGGMQFDDTEQFRAGYEAGVYEIDQSIKVLADYTSLDGSAFKPDRTDLSFTTRRRGCISAVPDVVMQAAGDGGSRSHLRGRGAVRRPRSASVGDRGRLGPVVRRSGVAAGSRARPRRSRSSTSAFYELVHDYLDGGARCSIESSRSLTAR